MWMDITILVIVLGSTIIGYIQGFMRTFLHTIGWLLAIVLSFVWCPAVVEFLKEKTDFYDAMQNSVAGHIASTAGDVAAEGTSGALSGIPDILLQAVHAATDAVAESLAGSLTDIFFNIAGFILVIAAIKFVFWFLMTLFSKRSNDGLTGWFDGIFGAAFGGVKGVVIVLVLLAVLVPITGISQSPFFLDALQSSKLAGALYNNNTVLAVVKEFL